ncbi:hypothetical protein LEN26_007629 [Aphanomyces euteiches]|nr:hypothetical protein AeMF1_009215 [Aphanomyces euteiches]KAH9131707.1 hypothetical protein LEN26_007629 [Aphanomyces euteiches]KAH9194181.1 hypothetical protein AeNC1_003832 [Aphanomyces euteiches]
MDNGRDGHDGAGVPLEEIAVFKVNKSKGKFHAKTAIATKPSHLHSGSSLPRKLEAPSFLRAKDEFKYYTATTDGAALDPSTTAFVGATLPTIHRAANGSPTVDKLPRRGSANRPTTTTTSGPQYKLTEELPVAVMEMTKPSILNTCRPRRRKPNDGPLFSNIVQGGRPPSRSMTVAPPRSSSRSSTSSSSSSSGIHSRTDGSNQDVDSTLTQLHTKASMSELEVVDRPEHSFKVVFRRRHDPTWRDVELAAFEDDFGSWSESRHE